MADEFELLAGKIKLSQTVLAYAMAEFYM